MKHGFWVFYCKTPSCHGIKGIQDVGEYHGQPQFLQPIIPETSEYTCPKCGKTHTYTVGDLRFQVSDLPD